MQQTQLCEPFPGCVVIVKEGDLGFPLKKPTKQNIYSRKHWQLEGRRGWKGGGRATGRTDGLDIKGRVRRSSVEGRENATRGSQRRQNHKTAFLICFQFWTVTVHFMEISAACLAFPLLILRASSFVTHLSKWIATVKNEGVI